MRLRRSGAHWNRSRSLWPLWSDVMTEGLANRVLPPREVWVAPGMGAEAAASPQPTGGALALVSGRSLNDIDLIFAPERFPAIGGHGAEMRLSTDSEAVATHAPPMDKELKGRLAAIAKLSPGILLEDKGYSLALHYRLAPPAEKAIYQAGSLIRADLAQE